MVAGSSSKVPGPSEVDISGEGRGSKRLITDTRDNLSSANAVLSNDDLLIEILLLLPAISLFLYKSVSKQWLSVISCPTFTLRLSQTSDIDPPCGLFVWGSKRKPKRKSKRNMFEYDFISFDIRVPSKSTVFTFGSKAPAKILQSCNGLLLCYIKPDRFFVYNPCVNLFKKLPQLHMSDLKSYCGIILVFVPTESPHYKVVHARHVVDDNNGVGFCILIETYSSETGIWSVCVDRILSYKSFIGFEDGVYWNGAIHWLNYDSEPLVHFKLDILVDHPVLTTVGLPVMLLEVLCCNRKFFESRGCLLLACKCYPRSRQLHIFEMRNGYSGWSMKYLVNLNDLMMPSPECWGINSSVWCIVLGEREEDSFIVIESHGKVLQHKLLMNTVRTLFNFGTSPRESFPFIASFAGV